MRAVSARHLLCMAVPARAESLKPLRDAVAAALQSLGVAAAVQEHLKLAVDEAAANVIRHAYGLCAGGDLRLQVSYSRGRLRFALRDHAPCVDPRKITPKQRSDAQVGGLGLHFINDVMDRWCVRPLRQGGNVLVMYKQVKLASGARAGRRGPARRRGNNGSPG